MKEAVALKSRGTGLSDSGCGSVGGVPPGKWFLPEGGIWASGTEVSTISLVAAIGSTQLPVSHSELVLDTADPAPAQSPPYAVDREIDTLEWLALSEKSFSFWENDQDALYDNL